MLNKIKEILKKYVDVEKYDSYSEIFVLEKIKYELSQYNSVEEFIDEMEKKEKIILNISDKKKLNVLLKYI